MATVYTPSHMLDTNICIYVMKHEPPEVAERFAEFYFGELIMSSITLGELEFGVASSVNLSARQKSTARSALKELCTHVVVHNFDADAAHSYGLLRSAHKDRKRDALDKLIAAHAVSLGVTLVTNNLSDFDMYANLKLENWV
jgi:tRNA(fMet)-specific endonuclease VapC